MEPLPQYPTRFQGPFTTPHHRIVMDHPNSAGALPRTARGTATLSQIANARWIEIDARTNSTLQRDSSGEVARCEPTDRDSGIR
jgi:hypothetical protein